MILGIGLGVAGVYGREDPTRPNSAAAARSQCQQTVRLTLPSRPKLPRRLFSGVDEPDMPLKPLLQIEP
jgi:hypothetical protein